MARGPLQPMPISARPSDHSEGGGRVWRWVFLSGLAHVVVIVILLITPFQPSKAPNYRVYTVDLVGGEKLGGGAGTAVAPAPEVQKAPEVTREVRKAKQETPPPPKVAKESKKKVPESRAEMTEKIAAAKAKKELEEAGAEKAREKLKQLRERRIEEALAAIRSRAETEEKKQQQQKAAATSTAVGEKAGAATVGAGGTGGGIVKGVEFVRYLADMKQRIKSSWTWLGRRTDLVVTMHFSIQDNGEITGLKLVRASGDTSYDDSVIRALKKASPLPPPPESYRKEFADVELDFTSKELGG